MIKLIKAEWLYDKEIRLSFSDGSYGVMDFSPLLSKKTAMTLPLESSQYFCRFFLELGALCSTLRPFTLSGVEGRSG
ncbi:hypothetical protein [Endozoicomonas sp. 4G]|uniref:hypothetical protein n=1 Tax=Endozoicomonas sp. 4G TaxID=2872754 RepID=UPI002078579A|nr:hypothetical protein [Endozoicomonas sp. 4G]